MKPSMPPTWANLSESEIDASIAAHVEVQMRMVERYGVRSVIERLVLYRLKAQGLITDTAFDARAMRNSSAGVTQTASRAQFTQQGPWTNPRGFSAIP